MPVGNVLVGDARRHVKHDDAALSIDVIAVAQTSEFLLSSRIPHVESNRTDVLSNFWTYVRNMSNMVVDRSMQEMRIITYRGEIQSMHLHTERGNVLLLKLARLVTLHERRL